ncbi:DUF4249 family protein [Rhodohalobacter barkolensis]|uniref:DUF4249 domain-containing protein n=1 Tax=Rhodohalobacter barkolensis TaxID=2053187 RepID=A0A2N0VKM6_9BACT|nr:DUF4249 family protein [Rhodohalobacter barkolensis]PKD44755.1 hypothetical protein CWD77_04635 [Rhodohalobacter barkolensis]
MKKYFIITVILFLSITACESYNQDDYQEYIVVEGYVTAGQSLPEIRLSTTQVADSLYDFENSAIDNAIVQITLLDEDGETEELFEYVQITGQRGIYEPIVQSYRVEPRRTYKLDVVFTDRPDQISATTTVPDQVEVINEVPESVVYQSDEQLEIVLAETLPTRDQNVFVFNTISLEPAIENLTPFYLSVVEDEDDVDINEYVRNSSGLINEGNFDPLPDGTILLRFPWIGVAFFGENLVVTLSVDKNLSDVIRSQEVQLGGSTLSPGEIPNLLYNIEGGIGVFGSLTADTIQTNFSRPF